MTDREETVPCRLLIDPPAGGVWNMAVDEAILRRVAASDCCVWRFYLWSEPTLSLGYFQNLADRNQHPPSRDCPVVRRPSGGGAIVHDIELTYSFTLSSNHVLHFGRIRLYDAVHSVLVEALAEFGLAASLFEPTDKRVDKASSEARTCDCPLLCFQRRSPGDVIVEDGHKVAGSAQRRLRGAVLQHGSVLLDCSPAAPELPGINQFARNKVSPSALITSWRERLARKFHMEFHFDNLTANELADVRRLAAEKYSLDAWTEFRLRR